MGSRPACRDPHLRFQLIAVREGASRAYRSRPARLGVGLALAVGAGLEPEPGEGSLITALQERVQGAAMGQRPDPAAAATVSASSFHG